MSNPMKHKDKRHWSLWDEDIVIFKGVNEGTVAFWKHEMTEDIVIFEM